MSNIDDLIAQMQEDERQDSLEVQELMTVGDFARARGVRPQLIHSYIKRDKLTRRTCGCGRLVISVKEANALLDKAEKDETEKKTGVNIDA